MAREYKDVVVGLDIGTAKIMAVVAEVLPTGELKLAGLGVAPSNGLKRGVVVNIEATVQSIQQALKEAEFMADCKIQRVYTGITGSHIRGLNSSGMVAVKDKEVTPADVARVVETAKAVNISSDQRLLLVEPQEFVIDGQDVKEPIGMSGIRLEAKVHIVTGRAERGRKHHQVRAPLRPRGRAAAAQSAGIEPGRAHRRRTRTRRGRGGHRRGHHRRGRFSRAGRSATRR